VQGPGGELLADPAGAEQQDVVGAAGGEGELGAQPPGDLALADEAEAIGAAEGEVSGLARGGEQGPAHHQQDQGVAQVQGVAGTDDGLQALGAMDPHGAAADVLDPQAPVGGRAEAELVAGEARALQGVAGSRRARPPGAKAGVRDPLLGLAPAQAQGPVDDGRLAQALGLVQRPGEDQLQPRALTTRAAVPGKLVGIHGGVRHADCLCRRGRDSRRGFKLAPAHAPAARSPPLRRDAAVL